MSDFLMQLAAASAAAPPAVAEAAPGLLASVSPVFLLLWAAALCLISAAVHSVLGEQKLLRPLLAETGGLMEASPLARTVTRFAWHWTSLLWLVAAAVLALAAHERITAPLLIAAIGGLHVVAGLADGIFSRGRHIGWPLITLIGALTLLAYYLTGQE